MRRVGAEDIGNIRGCSMGGSLVGRKADDVRRWADWYRKQRKLTWLSVGEFTDAGLSESGRDPKQVTKTKLRKAASRLLCEHQSADRTKKRIA